ncbi:ferredoxin [Brachybacterium tyrofermentans]|uniref:ferredoxin n=1 Tax=Brachybacterium tyrofermentans TaxID=47848 RepID=UPI003FD3A99C
MMQIDVDRAVCVGAGQCALTAPDVFDQDDDGLVVLLDPNAAEDPESEGGTVVRDAEALCPSRAIRVTG